MKIDRTNPAITPNVFQYLTKTNELDLIQELNDESLEDIILDELEVIWYNMSKEEMETTKQILREAFGPRMLAP